MDVFIFVPPCIYISRLRKNDMSLKVDSQTQAFLIFLPVIKCRRFLSFRWLIEILSAILKSSKM